MGGSIPYWLDGFGLTGLFWQWCFLLPVYYLASEYFLGFTLGKIVINTRVQDLEGGRPGFSRILRRTLIRMIPFEFVSALKGEYPCPWHDAGSGTRVVQAD
jgi:uncharacterized RDD family membrane protein YckC